MEKKLLVLVDNNTRRIISELVGIINFDKGEERFMRDIYLFILKSILRENIVR